MDPKEMFSSLEIRTSFVFSDFVFFHCFLNLYKFGVHVSA